MNIELKGSNYGCELVVTADNVTIVEDVESREYSRGEDGKLLPNPKRDIDTNWLGQIERVLSDMIYYREAEYDSQELIKGLFEKLPINVASELSKSLFETYSETE